MARSKPVVVGLLSPSFQLKFMFLDQDLKVSYPAKAGLDFFCVHCIRKRFFEKWFSKIDAKKRTSGLFFDLMQKSDGFLE